MRNVNISYVFEDFLWYFDWRLKITTIIAPVRGQNEVDEDGLLDKLMSADCLLCVLEVLKGELFKNLVHVQKSLNNDIFFLKVLKGTSR